VILGTSSYAQEAADLTREAGGHELTAFGENEDRARCSELIDGLPVLWLDDLAPLAETHQAVCAIVLTPLRRRFVRQAREMGFGFASIRHHPHLLSSNGAR
jgi:hypothetical protein